MSLVERKQQAREAAKARRGAIAGDPRDLVRRWPGMEPSLVIAGYWPLGTEADVRPLLEHLSRTHRVVLPVTPRDRLRLDFRAWSPGAAMEDGPFGTQHPVGTVGDAPLVPDVVLLPLLAWTRSGDRLGYGGGYYDATLTELRADNPALRAVGVAWDAQRVAVLPTEPHDERLDYVLSERGLTATHP